jgi:hypothetical protein
MRHTVCIVCYAHARYILHLTQYILHNTRIHHVVCIVHNTSYHLHDASYIIDDVGYIVYRTQCTMHNAKSILHVAECIRVPGPSYNCDKFFWILKWILHYFLKHIHYLFYVSFTLSRIIATNFLE